MGHNQRYPNLTRGYIVELLDERDCRCGLITDSEPDLMTARALYEIAVAQQTGHVVVLRDGAMVMRRSDRTTRTQKSPGG